MEQPGAEPAPELDVKTVRIMDPGGGGDAGADTSIGATGRRESADCSSGESNTQAKRSASAATQFKDSGVGGSGGSSGSGPEDGGQTSAQPAQRAPPVGKAGARGGKHKLARPEGHACCPRCDSENTKFCYYNNYNIKQPRYFCKECQRYWTAGGILRNVPPGSGRRKSKSSAAREQEKAAAAVTAKREARVPKDPQALPQPALVLPPGMGGGPTGADGGDGLLPQMSPAYAEQLCYMMDPSLAHMAAAAGMNGMGPLGMAPNMSMGIPGYDPSAGFPGPGSMMTLGSGGMTGGMGGTSRLAGGASLSLASNGDALSQGGGPGGRPSGTPKFEDGTGSDGRRVRTKLQHPGPDEPQGSGLSAMGTASVPAASAGGDDRHAEWAAAARAAERQQAATMAAQMAAAQAQLQQAAALQAQAHLHAAAASWTQPAGSYGMPGANMWRGAYGYPTPSWAAAARFGGSGFLGGEPSGTGSNGAKSHAGNSAADGSCELNAAGLAQHTGGWNGMMPTMPTGSAPAGVAPWPGAMPWGAPGGDMMGGSYPKGFGAGAAMGGGKAAPQGSSMGSGASAHTGMQAPSI